MAESRLSLLLSSLLGEPLPHQLRLLTIYLLSLGRRDRRQQPVHGVERSVRVVTRETVLVSPPVADVLELVDPRTLSRAENPSEDGSPLVQDDGDQCLRIPFGGICALRTFVPKPLGGNAEPALSPRRMHLPLDEGSKALVYEIESPADAFGVADCHISTQSSSV